MRMKKLEDEGRSSLDSTHACSIITSILEFRNILLLLTVTEKMRPLAGPSQITEQWIGPHEEATLSCSMQVHRTRSVYGRFRKRNSAGAELRKEKKEKEKKTHTGKSTHFT